MYSTSGHQLVVNEYFAECLRKAKEKEAERDAALTRVQDQDHDSIAAGAPERPAPLP